MKRYFTDTDIRKYLYRELADFYRLRNYQLAWYSTDGPLDVVNDLETALKEAPAEGLVFNYHLDTLHKLNDELFGRHQARNHLQELVQLDLLTTATYLTYASHLLSGVVDPVRYDKSWVAEPRRRPLASHLQMALQTGTVGESLRQLEPEYPQYQQLKGALSHYRAIADKGGWPILPEDTVLQKGDTSEVVLLLRQRLEATGDLSSTNSWMAMGNKTEPVSASPGTSSAIYPETNRIPADPATIFDKSVAAGLAHYQVRNGLIVDSILGTNTLHMLNIPVERRIRQIQLNMERLRWLPKSLGYKYVAVNVPEYQLRVFENQEKKLEMKVVVGKEYHSTPIFRDTIRYIEFSPTWTVPRSIAVGEILPELQKDSTYLQRNNMKLYPAGQVSTSQEVDPFGVDWSKVSADHFPYRIVQQPGAYNALGRIKFMFPNKYAIYLHDTPLDYLFNRQKRAYSHGCVRVEDPVALALYLLQGDPTWDRQRIEESMQQDSPVAQPLPEPVPVQFLYQTAFVDEAGEVNFREDIYGHDQKQLDAIPAQ